MAILNANPGNISTITGQAVAGDTIRLAAGVYGVFPQRANVVFEAEDWEVGRVLRGTTGHLGNGMGVRVTVPLNINQPGMTLRGIYHDTRGSSSINAGVISASGVVFEDCASSARPTSGARQIGYTLGTGAIRVSGIRFSRHRHHPTGQPNQNLDHAFYLKNCTGCRIEDTLIYDGGRFPLHLYTNADNNVFDRTVIWGSGGCVTFSGASDASTGTSVYGTSDNNTMRGCILGNARIDMIGAWVSDPNRHVSGNIVDACMMWRGNGLAPYPGAVRGVTITNTVTRDPGFRSPSTGDFTRTGTYDGYGPPQLFGAVTPPPPPSEDPRDALIQALKTDLLGLRTKVDEALLRFPN